MPEVFFNGQKIDASAATLPAASPACTHAVGAFETFRVYQGKTPFLADHLERLQSTLNAIGLKADLPEETRLAAQVAELARGTRLSLATGRFSVHTIDETSSATLLQVTPPRPLRRNYSEGYRLQLPGIPERNTSHRLNTLPGHKTNAYLGNRIALQLAHAAGFDETILAFDQSAVADAATANLFAVFPDGRIVTPPLEKGALPGVTRKHVLSLATAADVPIDVINLSFDELENAESIFLTNASFCIMPCSHLGNHRLRSTGSKRIAKLTRALADHIETQLRR